MNEIEVVRSRSPLTEVVAEHVELKRSGRHLMVPDRMGRTCGVTGLRPVSRPPGILNLGERAGGPRHV